MIFDLIIYLFIYLVMMRAAIHTMLIDLSKTCKPCKVKGIYPPKLNISKDQTDEELVVQLKNMISYLKNPAYSYLSKDKK